MTSVVAWGFGALIVLAVIAAGWWQIYDHGYDNAQKNQAQAEAKHARKKVAPASPREVVGIFRRLRARRERMRDKADRH